MRNRGVKVLAAAVALFVGSIVAWLVTGGVSTTHTTTREHTTVLIEPQTTPLPRDSGPRNNARRGPSASSPNSGSVGAVANPGPRRGSRPAGGDSTPAKTQRPHATHKRPAAPQQPNTGGQTPQPQPSKPPPPIVGVTVPAPATVCLRPAATVNC